MTDLYPEIEPFATHFLAVGDGHIIYIEESGNPEGQPVLVVHGGPGGASNPHSRRLHDPAFYRIIQFDQRGCGQSQPFASLAHNTTQDLVADMEKIRNYLGIDRWLVAGGSWGTTLALVYAIQCRPVVIGLILRGIFLGRQEDIDWLYQKGASDFYPENFAAYQAMIPQEERGNLVQAYYKRLTHTDSQVQMAAAQAWSNWEHGLVKLIPDPDYDKADSNTLAFSRLECHYFVNACFFPEDNYILNHTHLLADLPILIVHGRYDVDCRPSGAYALHQALPQSQLVYIQDAGHSQLEPGIAQQLVAFSDQAKAWF